MDKDETSELAARIVERDGLSASGENRTTEEIRESVLNIAALDQEAFERELGLAKAFWVHTGQKYEPVGYFGGGALRMHAVGEVYKRNRETLEIWWISPDNISKVIKNNKVYSNPSEQVIRMLVK